MGVTLGEEIMLLSLDDASGATKDGASTGWGVAGGILLDLVMAGRVTVDGGRLEVADRTPTGVPLLDGRLERIADWTGGGKRRKASDWLAKDQAKSVRAAVESLCGRGLVAEERVRVLGLFPVRRYPEADGSVEREVRERLASVVVGGADPDDRTAALVALLHAAELYRQAFPGLPRKQVEPRMAGIAEGNRVGDSVRRAIRDVRAAVAVATTITVVAAAS
ncbi:GOLPH3/VPS74 family protein [Streptomyces fenghuangensis]|uniref:GOLPH3/VPS74 family protein n=1 Tax=Streptomyces sp. ICN903 TaxID=2964654 RepID=UPI001EDBBCF7|nr:GPP34 family phosphoprotein [Streptomyces sp. ICN903]MCG3042879.1 GPP34 family phosphoprotein [Streptomyces sp. ICN903]